MRTIERSRARRGHPEPAAPLGLRTARPVLRQSRPLEGPEFYYNATARDLMTRDVVTVRRDASLLDALDIMRVRNVSGMPVVDAGGKVLGVLSERDVARAVIRRGEVGRIEGGLDLFLAFLLRRPDATLKKLREILGGQRVDRVMSRRMRTVPPDATVETIVRELVAHRVNRLPVLDHGRLVGIITRSDVLSRGVLRYPAGVRELPQLVPESTPREARRVV